MQVGLAVILASLNGKRLWELLDFSGFSFANLELKKHIKPMALLFLTIFTISVYFSLDTILLGFLADNESVGYYSSALKLNRLFIGVLSAISVAMFPGPVSLYHKGEKEAFVLLVKQCFYVLVSNDTKAMRDLCLKDLFFLITVGFKRKDLDKDWLYDRIREIEANPDDYLDLWARDHYKSTCITYAKSIQDITQKNIDNLINYFAS